MLRRKLAPALALAFAASLMLASGAFAKDRNHDRIPDKWEKRHHLSLKHKQGRRDQDHDGLKNRGEWRARLDPREADTDGDGVDDGDENTGTVESFEDGVLTISLFNGDTITGAVTDDTEIECDDDADDDRGHDDHGDDDGDHHHGDHGDDDEGDDDHGDDARAAHRGDDDEGNEDCGTEALVAGAKVLEAELKIRDGEAAWDEVELFTP
ncbi:MAG TPA: hypothetical protein VFM58_06400 [Solirubrobacteraceae bacterium]|nr:hypothetical protein [Solirubrobacteraceae bacterium]